MHPFSNENKKNGSLYNTIHLPLLICFCSIISYFVHRQPNEIKIHRRFLSFKFVLESCVIAACSMCAPIHSQIVPALIGDYYGYNVYI